MFSFYMYFMCTPCIPSTFCTPFTSVVMYVLACIPCDRPCGPRGCVLPSWLPCFVVDLVSWASSAGIVPLWCSLWRSLCDSAVSRWCSLLYVMCFVVVMWVVIYVTSLFTWVQGERLRVIFYFCTQADGVCVSGCGFFRVL